MTSEEIRLHGMWTPEMLSRFEADMRALIQSSEYPGDKEELVKSLRQRAEKEVIGPRRSFFRE